MPPDNRLHPMSRAERCFCALLLGISAGGLTLSLWQFYS